VQRYTNLAINSKLSAFNFLNWRKYAIFVPNLINLMAYTRITAAEGAAMIKDGDNIALSGFTPNGNPKAVFRELSKRAIKEHAEGKPLAVGIFTGASSCQSIEGDMANAHAIKFRAPFSTNEDFRHHVNLEEIDYEDMHLGHMAERLRHGFYGQMDWAIIEVSDMEEGETECKAYLTSAGGIVATAVRLAKKIILEHNTFHNPNSKFLHDTWEPGDNGWGRGPMPVLAPYDRVGNNYISIDPKKIVGVVESCIPEEARCFKAVDEFTSAIGSNLAKFLVKDMKAGRIPPQFLPIQSGVGATGNAVLAAMGSDKEIPRFNVYSEVVQDAAIDWMLEGKIMDASATAMTVTNECLMKVYDNMDYFSKHLTIRQSEVANSPEVIRRLGVIALNTAVECDIYGNENSSHICGSKLMNGIGGSCDYERNGYISVFTTPSIAKGGKISSIVPMCTHVDSTEHDVDLIVTERGVADLRGKGPMRRAEEVIENCAHPDYKPILREYLKIADKGHQPQSMRAAFAMHDTLMRKGDMRLTDFSEYL
jgi:succinate CoA transferase